MSQELLDQFGKTLIQSVRDKAIKDIDKLVNGHAKGLSAQVFKDKLKKFSSQELEVTNWLTPQIVDMVLHHLLWTLEQDDSIKVSVDNDKNHIDDLNNVSDGLSGELYTEDGWIMRYSEERYDEI